MFDHLESLLDCAFDVDSNPVRQLGAMAWFFYWIVIASGIYVYIFFDTGITQAYLSVEHLTNEQWYAGGIMRSFHRYASDALVLVIMLHLIREFAWDRLHGARYFTWITGVALLWLLYASGITGYWIVWDKLAQYIAIASAEWLDSLPLFGEPIARNFLTQSMLSGRFFTLFIFIHIFVPLLMLFFMWLHIQRLSLPRVNPSNSLMAGTLAALLILSLALPAESQGPAVLHEVPDRMGIDWFYLFIFPMLDHVPGITLWISLFVITFILILLPWVPRLNNDIAVVDLANCNGCGRCEQDCPYSAIMMAPRTDGLPYQFQAEVNPGLCTGCGICTGACPTATPYRRRSALVPGIQLQGRPMDKLREEVIDKLGDNQADIRILLVNCEQTARFNTVEMSGVTVITLPCVGMFPPSFMDFVLSQNLADGICIYGCVKMNCYQRLGNEWTMQRMDRQRDPFLRERVDRDRMLTIWSNGSDIRDLHNKLDQFHQRLKARLDQACQN
ncbi:MAG: hydrogenase iron-sulfur subunit [Thiotrichales bacterium]|nr:hydrogenase iron-sulfur subunit [Thiotrichales bacterium]